jgi:hypothetical protein
MGLLNTLKQWNQKRFNKKLDKWYKEKGGGQMEYNPMLSNMNFKENELQKYVDNLNENFVWSRSDPAELFMLYSRYREDDAMNQRRGRSKQGINRIVQSNWWYAKLFIDNEEGVENAVRYSTGVAAKIPSTMATLCMGNGYNYSIHTNDQDENDEVAWETLDYIINENSLHKILMKAFRTQSWGGGFAFKWSLNQIFDTPILEVYSPMNYKYKSVAGRIVEDIFIKYYYKSEYIYKLEEVYGEDDEGAYIKFFLYRAESGLDDPEWDEVAISIIPETATLRDIHLKGYFNRLSVYVPNRGSNSNFPDSLYGETDYAGSYGALNFLDEAYSTYSQELRDGRLQKYMPDTMGDFDDEGNATYASFLRSTHIITKGGIGQDADDKIEYQQAVVDTLKSLEAIKQNYMIVLNNAGQLGPMKHFTA